MAKQNFEQYVSMQPEFGPVNATEEPNAAEKEAYEDIHAEVLEFIHGPQGDNVVKMLQTAPELYQGVGQAAFQILLATKQKLEGKNGKPLPPAALWGEGAGIHTTVDELYQLAKMENIPGSEQQDQYMASMFEVYRLAGDHIQNSNEDESINEAQDLIADIEMTGSEQPLLPQVFNSPQQKQLDGAIARSIHQRQASVGNAPADASMSPQAAPGTLPGGRSNG
jgi:hypothetical protein